MRADTILFPYLLLKRAKIKTVDSLLSLRSESTVSIFTIIILHIFYYFLPLLVK